MQINMNDIDHLITLIRGNVPFCFVKMNDGEISNIKDLDSVSSRGNQKSSLELSRELNYALRHKQKNYFVGIPCYKCYPDIYKFCMEGDVKNFTLANLLINSNLQKTFEYILPEIRKKRIALVHSREADVRRLRDIGIDVDVSFSVPDSDAWGKFGDLRDACMGLNVDVVIFCCGPLGRVLACRWFEKRPDLTCLELGSMFDPVTKGMVYMYHVDLLPRCECCNVSVENRVVYSDEVLNKCHHWERFHFGEWDWVRGIYGGDLVRMFKYYGLHLRFVGTRSEKYYCRWMMCRCLRELGRDESVVRNAYLLCFKEYGDRVECLFEYLESLKDEGERFRLAWMMKDVVKPREEERWVDGELYDWKVWNMVGLSGYHSGNFRESYEGFCKTLEKCPEWYREKARENVKWGEDVMRDMESYGKFLGELDGIKMKGKMIGSEKIIHFIWISGGHEFTMSHFIAVKSAFLVQKPDKIYFWVNEEIDNFWWKACLKYVEVMKITVPRFINGVRIDSNQHKADVMRINILNRFGGVYFDMDLLSLRSVWELKREGRRIVMARECENKICNCFIMAEVGTGMIGRWIREYETKYGKVEDWWGGLSVCMPHELSLEFGEEIEVVERRVVMPFMYNDWRFFEENGEVDLEGCYCVHLWDTELMKTDFFPVCRGYFEDNEDGFSRVFGKYVVGIEDEDL